MVAKKKGLQTTSDFLNSKNFRSTTRYFVGCRLCKGKKANICFVLEMRSWKAVESNKLKQASTCYAAKASPKNLC